MYIYCLILVLLVVAIIDIKTKTIPPIASVVIIMLAPLNPLWTIQSALIAILVCGGILLLSTIIVKGSFGGGDIKIVSALSYTLCLEMSVTGLFLATAVSLAPCIYYQLSKKQTHIAFAPYITVGYILAVLLLG